MAAEQENSEQASTLLGKHKRQVLAGAAVVLVSLGALWAYLMWGAVKPETVVAEPVIGVLDMQQLIKAHSTNTARIKNTHRGSSRALPNRERL